MTVRNLRFLVAATAVAAIGSTLFFGCNGDPVVDLVDKALQVKKGTFAIYDAAEGTADVDGWLWVGTTLNLDPPGSFREEWFLIADGTQMPRPSSDNRSVKWHFEYIAVGTTFTTRPMIRAWVCDQPDARGKDLIWFSHLIEREKEIVCPPE